MPSSPSRTKQNEGKSSKRTRLRVPSSCETCRRKKLRCDRKRPACTYCLMKNNGEACKYEVQRWPKDASTAESAIDKLQEEISSLKEKIKILETIPKIQDASNSGTSVPLYTPPYKLFQDNFNRNDTDKPSEAFSLSKLANKFSIKQMKILYFGPTSYMFLLQNDFHSAKVFSAYFHDQLENFKVNTTSLETQNDAAFRDSCAPFVGNFKTGIMNIDTPHVLPTLPSTKVVNLLVQRFFKLCYTFVPFIEERVFMNELGHIFKDKKQLGYEDLRNKTSTVAILLTMLRFAYLTLPIKKYHKQSVIRTDRELLLLIENSNINIPVSYVEYAENIVTSRRKCDKTDFRKLQAILLLQIYREHCPEYEDKTSSSNVLFAIVAQMARFHGLHNDPTHMTVIALDYSDIHLWRKTWSTLLYHDSLEAFEFGMPSLVEDKIVETKEPFTDHLSEFLPPEERRLERFFRIKRSVIYLIRQSVRLLNQGGDNIDVRIIEKIGFDLRYLLDNSIQKFEVLCESRNLPAEISGSVHEIAIRMLVLHHVFVLHYLLYLSTKDNLKDKNLRIAVEYAFIIIGIGFQFAKDPSLIVSPEFETIIAPQIWNPVKTVVCLFSGILLKALNGEGSLLMAAKEFHPCFITSPFWSEINHENEMDCIKSFFRVLEQFYLMIVQISIKHYHCYVLCVILKTILDFFKSNYPESMQFFPNTYDNTNPTTLDAFWQNANVDITFTFEEFLMQLNYNADPFLNEIT